MTQTIKSLEGFVRKIKDVQPAHDEVLIYRGHSNQTDFKLLPSVLRDPKFRDAEHTILRELVASHPTDFASDYSTLEQLARVQHYSLPTRLLDVTWNPLVALFFAAKDNPNTPGEVIVFRVKSDKVKFYDSDTASCVANLAHLKPSERDSIDFNLTGQTFNSQSAVDRLLQFIRAEKPHFRGEIDPNDLQTVLAVKPKQNNSRILSQSGAFLLFGISESLDVNQPAVISIERIRINKKGKSVICKELNRMAINSRTMFPEIEKSALYIRDNL